MGWWREVPAPVYRRLPDVAGPYRIGSGLIFVGDSPKRDEGKHVSPGPNVSPDNKVSAGIGVWGSHLEKAHKRR